MIYVLLINLYWALWNLNSLIFSKINSKLKKFIIKTGKKYRIDKYEKELKKNYKFKELSKFIILIFKLLISILINIILVECILRITNNPENIIYRISKISIITSLFCTYIIIQVNNTFYDSIVSIYELILTAIIIPIILEKLITQKEKNNTQDI